jgi:hypothetical protein
MLGWSAALVQIVVLFSVSSLVMVYRLEQQRLLLFDKCRFEASVMEKDRRGKECTADEIRRIISNVSHDIKTVCVFSLNHDFCCICWTFSNSAC